MVTKGMCSVYSALKSSDSWMCSIELATKSGLARPTVIRMANQLIDGGAADLREISRMHYYKLSSDSESKQITADIKETIRILNNDC